MARVVRTVARFFPRHSTRAAIVPKYPQCAPNTKIVPFSSARRIHVTLSNLTSCVIFTEWSNRYDLFVPFKDQTRSDKSPSAKFRTFTVPIESNVRFAYPRSRSPSVTSNPQEHKL